MPNARPSTGGGKGGQATLRKLIDPHLKFNYKVVTRLAQTVAGWQAACEDRQNF